MNDVDVSDFGFQFVKDTVYAYSCLQFHRLAAYQRALPCIKLFDHDVLSGFHQSRWEVRLNHTK